MNKGKRLYHGCVMRLIPPLPTVKVFPSKTGRRMRYRMTYVLMGMRVNASKLCLLTLAHEPTGKPWVEIQNTADGDCWLSLPVFIPPGRHIYGSAVFASGHGWARVSLVVVEGRRWIGAKQKEELAQ